MTGVSCYCFFFLARDLVFLALCLFIKRLAAIKSKTTTITRIIEFQSTTALSGLIPVVKITEEEATISSAITELDKTNIKTNAKR